MHISYVKEQAESIFNALANILEEAAKTATELSINAPVADATFEAIKTEIARIIDADPTMKPIHDAFAAAIDAADNAGDKETADELERRREGLLRDHDATGGDEPETAWGDYAKHLRQNAAWIRAAAHNIGKGKTPQGNADAQTANRDNDARIEAKLTELTRFTQMIFANLPNCGRKDMATAVNVASGNKKYSPEELQKFNNVQKTLFDMWQSFKVGKSDNDLPRGAFDKLTAREGKRDYQAFVEFHGKDIVADLLGTKYNVAYVLTRDGRTPAEVLKRIVATVSQRIKRREGEQDAQGTHAHDK